jgi:hypothetical protein
LALPRSGLVLGPNFGISFGTGFSICAAIRGRNQHQRDKRPKPASE